MARVRQLMLGLASGSALYSGMAPALGLGEITLHSALNQPLEAEIELLAVGDLGAEDLRVALAPAEVFSRSGVERFYFLNDLRFTPLLRGSRSVIRVVSSRPVREPYLNFIVEVARPGGQLLREYTVLLDPPGSAAYTVQAAPSPAAAAPTPSAAQPAAAPVRRSEPPSATQGHRQAVARGDSLWSIAARLREQGSPLSQQALMDGILSLNPAAFIGGDANRLLAGVELLLPDAARPSTAAAAAAPVEPPAMAVEASVAAPLAAAPPAAEPTESLQQVLEKQRQVDQELASQAAENLQLQQGLAQLQLQLQQQQLQLQQLQEQLRLKDAQLAELTEQGAPVAPPVDVPALAAVTSQEEPVAAERGWFATLLAGGVVLLLLLGALVWAARRREKAASVVQVEPPAQRPVAPLRPAPVAVAKPAVAPTPAPTPQQRPAAPVDPLEAANVYIAYGRFSEARGELSKALAQAPQRSDLRLRLLEVLAELGDGAAFEREEAVLRAEGFDAARLDALKARHPALQQAPQPAHSQPLVAPPAAEPDFQLNLDDLPLDADWDMVSPFEAARGKTKAAAAAEFDAGFSSNLQELPEVFELDEEVQNVSAFGEMEMVVGGEDELLDEHFLDAFAGEADATAALQGDIEQLAGNPEHMAKLNQALAYIEQGNLSSACDILNEVIDQGDDRQKQAARQLLAEIA
ncbi:FimV/HubP family polar landmark protein [Pseudomonas sp. NPDC077649]|uniref:FimV/HubP family polar landmark protein n=1 Tax=Pseudomonas sp. NPDC077649 TaxID=3364423 RepID=UPI0037C6DC86